MERVKLMYNSVLAGALIGIGDIALMQIESRYIGALLFSLALLSIIQLRIPLYTGRIGGVIHKKNYIECIWILAWNVVGACISTMLYSYMNPDMYLNNVIEMAGKKFSNDFVYLFIAGILCNVLIHIAVTCKNTVITILCIMCFILCGFEHSIADAGYLIGISSFVDIVKWFAVLLGNTVGGICTELFLMREVKY